MRILQVAPYFAPAYAYGGPPETVHKLCEALANRGHEITVLTTDALSSTERQRIRHKSNGLNIYYLKNLSNYLAWNHQLFLPLGTSAFLRKQAKRFDLIHIHSFRTYQNFAVRRQALCSGTPYILSAHGSVPRIVRKKFAETVFDAIVGSRVLQDAEALIAVSKAEMRQYEKMGVPASKIALIPNGVDAKEYSVLPARGTFSREYGLEGKRLIAYIGRLNARKGLDTLLESMHKLVEIRADVALVLVGPDDGYRGQIERMIDRLSLHDHVLLTGLITLPRKLEVFVDCDVVVYPGAFEIFGLVPFEALLCRRPVIVADDSGCGEIVADARAGITVPVGNPASLQAAIEYVLENPESIEPMTERGRKYVLERMNWTQIAAETERLYLKATDGGRLEPAQARPHELRDRG